ncbi:hypothetical protein KR054_005615 [Drosophila jambulina]|nr:hypothetical protein KR054_005615 [Drosophila jambulina]
MDSKGQDLGIMGPPPAVAHTSSRRADAPPLPASTPSPNARTAAPPRRIIKTINLDFKKLKEAGLDRKLAEVLSKQSPAARAGITHSPSSSSSSSSVATQSATTTAAATSAVTAASASSTSLNSQQQQLHQPASPQTAVKRIRISDCMEKTVPIETPPLATTSSSSLERSMHVKAMLKNRILNKSMNPAAQTQKQKPMSAPKTQPAAAQSSASRTGGSSNASAAATTSGAFSIPKADLSVRPKHPPLLLNLVNQLPKHRTMCVTTDDIQLRNQQELLQQKAFEKHPPPQQKSPQYQSHSPHAPSATAAAAPPEAPLISQKSPSPPPLIVLENKVLAPNEKIDLSNLGLPSSTSIVATILKTKSQPAAEAIIKGGKVIMNASRFKVPPKKLAEMAEEIRNQAKQVKLNAQAEATVPSERDSFNTIPSEVDLKLQSGITPSSGEVTDLIKLKANLTPPEFNESEKPMSVNYASDTIDNSTAAQLEQGEHRQEDESTESSCIDIPVNRAEPEDPKVVMSTETSFLNLPIHISTGNEPKQQNISPGPEQEPSQAEEKPKNTSTSEEAHETSSPVSKVQSAVDFIAQLSAEHPLDESSFMDLSPEEQRLNALFGGAGGCSFTGVSPQKTEVEKEMPEDAGSLTVTTPPKKPQEEEELPIGKIVKMDDMDILHATLDVSSDSTNILRISPNAIKLRSSVDKSIMELPAVTTAEVAILPTNVESLVNAAPSESHEDEQHSELDESSKGSLQSQLEPVPDSEPAKEINPPAKRVPLRSKRAKINLVQRNKRPSIPNKPLEAKKTKLDDAEAGDTEATSSNMDQSLLIEDRLGAGVKGIEVIVYLNDQRSENVNLNLISVKHNPKQVPADEEQGVGEDDDQQGVSQSKENKEQKASHDEKQQEEASSKSQADGQNAAKSSIERDLTQLYHPPKMPKTKTSKKNSNQEALEQSQPAASVSLIEILAQEPPPPQGDAKLPFRKELPTDANLPESTGIQNLLTHLTAEKVTPQTKKKLSPTPPSSEETTKGMPRKKRVKTRPLLSKRNSGKKHDENALEFPHPVNENVGGGRIPTSSTSDDDGSVFLGFNNKDEKRSKTPVRSKRVRQMRINETDISDDATPDYDETEEEQMRPVGNDIRRIEHVSDSDSSAGPMYLEDDPVTEDTSLDKTLVSKEVATSEKVNWEDLKTKSEAVILDATIEPESEQEALNEPGEPESVINQKDSTIDDNKFISSRKSRNPSRKKDLDTTAVKIDIEDPSTSEEASKTSKAKAKLQINTGCESVKDYENPNLPQATVEEKKDSVSNKNQEELKAVEELETSVKSKGKRRSRLSNVTSLRTETDSEQKEDESKINETPKKAVVTKEKRKTRTSSVSQPVINLPDKGQPIELTSSVNLEKRRSSRPKTKSDSTAPPISEHAAPSFNPLEPVEAVKTRASRLSRSRNTKEPLPAQPITKSEESHADTGGQREPEEVKAADEPSHSDNARRQTRCRKSTVGPLPVAEDQIKCKENIKNSHSQNPQEVKPAEEPDHSLNSMPKRQSHSKTAKILDSVVSKNTTTQKGSQEEIKVTEKPNQTSTCKENSVPNPKNVDATDDADTPSCSIKSKRKRQSRNTPHKVSNLAAAEEIEPTASLADSQPAEIDDDAIKTMDTRRSSSRLSSVPKEIADAPAFKPDSNPKRNKSLIAGEGEPDAAAPSTSKRKRKRDASADAEPNEASKKLKTELKQDHVVPQAFNPRLLLIRQREQLDTDEVLTDEGKGKGPLQCGLCLARSTEKDWQTHLGEHYGVGWLVGETPNNITRSGVMLMMKAYLEESKKKLVCRLCDHYLGSALGMMLHLETCGNKQRVECEICRRSYTILTLPSHFRVCSRRQQLAETSIAKAEQQVTENAKEMVFSNAGRAKRKSTIKAETKLKKIGEHTSAKNEFDGSDSSDYDMAKDKESSEEYDSEGVDSNEDSIAAERDGSDSEKPKHSRKRTCKKRPGNLSEHATKPLFLREETQKSSSAHKWKEFLQINYSEGPLYCHLVPGYSTLSLEEAQSLLPSKETTSVRYAYGKVSQDSDWKRLAPLDGFNKEGEYVGYLGGPVRQLVWVPLPSNTTNQYLLCNLRSRMKSFARHSKLKQEEGLLMLLKCTVGTSDDETWTVRPELHYGIRVPNGPVHSFAFLPSGGYDQATNRLGLLAVAHATSDVHIYALPLELKEEEKDGENVVINLDAVITLSLDVDQPPTEDQCTKICWSEASGHSFLATGYASGRIAFWDIGDTESINCFRRNNDQAYAFVPSNTLYLGERNIQFMELHYDMNGIRWLAVGTSVRKFLVYDIMNWSQPTTLMQSSWNNIYLATFTWSPISEAIVLSSTRKQDRLFLIETAINCIYKYSAADYNSRAILLNPAGIEFDSRTLDSTLSASRSMHTNCQQNYMVLVTDIGDLAFLDAKPITRGAYLAKTMINYRAVSTSKLCHLGAGKPNPNDVISTDEFHRDYGVQINPLVEVPPQSARNCPYLSDKRLPSNPHSLALTRNNCVRCNWNSSAHSLVAMGAEHGLLRILNFKRNKFF